MVDRSRPPRQLMALPPLGRLVNAFLTGLNELRRCLLPGILSKLRESLEEVLKEVASILQVNERAVMTPGLRGDAVQLREIAKEMQAVMENVVVPYVRGALEASLGNKQGAKDFFDKLVVESQKEEEVKEEEVGDVGNVDATEANATDETTEDERKSQEETIPENVKPIDLDPPENVKPTSLEPPDLSVWNPRDN